MLLELKHGESTNKAISQIDEKDYIVYLRKEEYQGDVLLIGVNYSPDTKEHVCRIESDLPIAGKTCLFMHPRATTCNSPK